MMGDFNVPYIDCFAFIPLAHSSLYSLFFDKLTLVFVLWDIFPSCGDNCISPIPLTHPSGHNLIEYNLMQHKVAPIVRVQQPRGVDKRMLVEAKFTMTAYDALFSQYEL